jgi:hypothetical protein
MTANAPKPAIASLEGIRFPRLYAAIKWTIIVSLTFLAILAAAFWTLVLGGFASSGFHASKPSGSLSEDMVITPECAWPYAVSDHDAKSVCKMFYNLTPEQRAEVLRARK